MALFRKRPTPDTNTLTLIRRWSMDGARADLDGRFGSPVDIQAMVSERDEAPRSESPPASAPVLMKLAGEDGWQPLLNPA